MKNEERKELEGGLKEMKAGRKWRMDCGNVKRNKCDRTGNEEEKVKE